MTTKRRKIKVEIEVGYCSCRKNKCLKKYCECFKYGLKCAPGLCGCTNCGNSEWSELTATPPYFEVVGTISDILPSRNASPALLSSSGSSESSVSDADRELLNFTSYLEEKKGV